MDVQDRLEAARAALSRSDGRAASVLQIIRVVVEALLQVLAQQGSLSRELKRLSEREQARDVFTQPRLDGPLKDS